jgi:phospholipase/carboxylesterase
MYSERFGSLKAKVTGGADGEGGGAGPVVVLMHGFGAPGDDLVDLARFLRVPAETRFVFPEAPLTLDGGPGRAWWIIDPEVFERRARGEQVDRSEELPDNLPVVRAAVIELLNDVEKRLSVPRSSMILGGFSQGAMVACDVALHDTQRPAGLLLMSGTLIARAEWAPRMERLAGLPILQSHGVYDPMLSYADAERLRDLWQAAGAQVTFTSFPGGHEIPRSVLEAAGHFISKYAAA